MKKLIMIVAAVSVCAALLAGCGTTGSAPTSSSSEAPSSEASSAAESTSSSSQATSDAASASSDASDSASTDTTLIDAARTAIEAINPIDNPRAIDETSLQYDMNVDPSNIAAFVGNVTNNQDDCALVFVAEAKDGAVDTVKSELEAYRASLASNNLYAEFADKVAKAKDARVFTKDNYVAMVISGINGPDYADIDAALEKAFA